MNILFYYKIHRLKQKLVITIIIIFEKFTSPIQIFYLCTCAKLKQKTFFFHFSNDLKKEF